MGGSRLLRARATVVAAGLALVCLTGCGGAEAEPKAGTSTSPASGESTGNAAGAPDGKPGKSGEAPAGGGGSTAVPVADPEHAVDPPGRLTDRLYGADILIFKKKPLSASMLEQIEGLDGVAAVESIGLGQVILENRSLQVAAVDPATYRRFTPAGSATLQEAWNRVAGGEVAISPELGKRLADDDGELTMGGDKDAPQIHIGAYAPQAEQVDAVVNEKWGEELGMQLGNALLVSTDQIAPEAVRKPLQRIVGDDASVQRLDIAARLGLDTSVKQTVVLTGGSIADVVGTFNYTILGGGRIAPEPSWVSRQIATGTVPILGSVTCNRAIFPQLEAALEEVALEGLADEINPGEYAGCYYPRFIAGSTSLSNHSFGLALDLNVPGNQRGTVGEMDREVVSIFKKWGFAWGGDWGYTDPMHFELNQLVKVGQ